MSQQWPGTPVGGAAPAAAPSGDIIVKRADPYKAEDQQFQRDAAARAAAADARAADAAERQKVQDQQGTESERTAGYLTGRMKDAVARLSGAAQKDKSSLAPTLGVEVVRGTLGDTPANYITDTERQIVRAAQYDILDSALTLGTGAAYTKEQIEGYREAYFPKLGDDEATVRSKNEALRQLLVNARVKAGRAAPDVDAAIAALSGLDTAQDAPPPVAPAGFDPGPAKIAPNTSGVRQEDDPALVQAGVKDAFAAMLAQSVEPGPAIQKLRELGVTDPIVLRDAAAQLDFRRKNPNVPLEKYSYPAIDDRAVDLSGFEKAATAIGSSAPGAYVINAGQALSGNTLDNLSANPEAARAAIEVANAQSPNAATFGQVSGGVMGALAGEAALARFGVAPGIARGFAADTAMGAASGAGAADNAGQSRLGGAAMGAGAAALGNAAGNAITRGVGRVVAPTGGNMNALYGASVRPTLGQRMVDKGVLGRAVNATEEALQSFPLIGAAVQGSRQEARDQFQIGAFNEALKEVGEQLPKGMGPGTAPNAYAQKTFDRIYAEARSGMVMRGDDQLVTDMDALDQQVATLAEGSAKRFNAIFKNVVDRRAKNGGGEVAGKEYKAMISDLGKQIRAIRSNPNGDMELASVLEDLQSTLDNTARRHSDPDAVKLLDAADAGYAKLVRIEDAARRAGGDAGTFTPAQFERSVQNNGGGVRSKAFLRGDALMQDYAEQGKGLVDRLPNSGTVDRGLAATALVGGSYVSPAIGIFLGTIGAAYAPGVRKGMQAALSPAGPKRKAIGEQLKKISRSASAASASTAVASQGTSPGQ